jgi:hypothetical protein
MYTCMILIRLWLYLPVIMTDATVNCYLTFMEGACVVQSVWQLLSRMHVHFVGLLLA